MDRDWTDKRMDDFADRVDRFERNVDLRFDKVDQRFDKVDQRFDKVEAEARRLSARSEAAIAVLGGKMDKMNRRLTGGLITVVGAVIIKVFVG
jgi:hypothetical protein